MREIARRLARAPSTSSREVRRNAATRSGGFEYRATTGQWHADRAARRPKPEKLALNAQLQRYVQERLAGAVIAPSSALIPGRRCRGRGAGTGRGSRGGGPGQSPKRIARRLPRDFPDDEAMRISHEAIYQALYVQWRGALRRELTAYLRTGRALRVPRARTRARGTPFVTPEVLISHRPAEVTDRAVPGHWEGDLILGLGSSAIGTLVERTTRFTLLLHLSRMVGHGPGVRVKNGPALAGHGAEAVRDAIARTIVTLPAQLCRSLTWDQRPSAGETRPKRSMRSYNRLTQAVLQRPVELGQYLSIRYTARLAEPGIERSVSSTGESYDNALAESVIGFDKTEEIRRRGPWKGVEDVEFATLEWVAWYNIRRLLEPIGYVSPDEFEQAYYRRHTARDELATLT